MLLSGLMIALPVVFSGGTMRFRRVIVMRCRLFVRLLWHDADLLFGDTLALENGQD